ncbi:hypothetical protein [Delftia acidovorans]|uniref:Uncharacterized protein n=1 Tax=Delftia acidovorans TaxID=80866 RepID=A0AAJ2R458_DELAC|nr:hypothetical protein [Delftia acidovorans]MDX4957875.1 hypothetical protein [Delftia acidovorans]
MSEEFKDGGPAYPMADPFVVSTPKNVAEAQRLAQGMSLRDHFAGLAMLGELSSQSPDGDDEYNYREGDEAGLAKWCYQMADAMLRAREKEQS